MGGVGCEERETGKKKEKEKKGVEEKYNVALIRKDAKRNKQNEPKK